MDAVIAKDGAFEELQRMREEGLVKFIGLGVREHEFHRIAIETGVVDVILTYLDYNLIRQTAADSLLPLARENDIGVINGSPIAKGCDRGRAELRSGNDSCARGNLEATADLTDLALVRLCVLVKVMVYS